MSNNRTLVSGACGGEVAPLPGKTSRRDELRQRDMLASLYERLEPCLRWRAQSWLRNPEDAKEVVQETFAAFMRAGSTRQGGASDSTFLQGILKNQTRNRIRQRSRGAAHMDTRDHEDEASSSSLQEANLAHDGGLGRVEALNELVTLTRGETAQTLSVAWLYLLEKRTFEEIGHELGLSRKVVSQMLREFVERVRRRRG